MAWDQHERAKAIGEKIGSIIGMIIVIGLIIAGIVAFISDQLTFADITSWFMNIIVWFMNTIGWWLIGAVVIVLVILLLIMGLLWLIPKLWIASGFLGVLLLVQGYTVAGVIFLIIAAVIGFKFFLIDGDF